MYIHIYFFFFSSRRRHTRLTCDWSSDVCSSDLEMLRCAQHDKQLRLMSHLARSCIILTGGGGRDMNAIALVPTTIDAHCRSEERRVGKECRSGGWPER